MKIILFGVGSPLIVEYEETCRRRGFDVVAGVRNRDGESFLSDADRLWDAGAIDAALLEIACICPLFTPANRRIACSEAEALGFKPAPALLDPHAVVASTAEIGHGSYVNTGAVIGAAAHLGRHVVVNRQAGIGHHARIGDFVSIGPGAVVSGQIEIGEGALIGAGAVILPKLKIGAGALVGAGAVVTRNVPAGVFVWGNPARIVKA